MRCEGWILPGSFMTLGPRTWKQCKNKAIVMIEFKQDDEKIKILPGCSECWQKCIDAKNIEIISVEPIKSNKPLKNDALKRAS